MNKPASKVSIVVPVYNAEAYLRECLDSLVNQTLRDIEIIVVDDASTDGGKDIVRQYAARDKRIVLVEHAVNEGVGQTCNDGLERATGEYVTVLDSDDIAFSHAYGSLYHAAMIHDADCVRCSCLKYYPPPHMHQSLFWGLPDDMVGRLLNPDEVSCFLDLLMNKHWAGIYRRRIVANHGVRYLKKRTSIDYGFTGTFFIIAESMFCLNEPLFYYRQMNPESLSSVWDSDRCLTWIETRRRLDDLLVRLGERHGRRRKRYNAYFAKGFLRCLAHLTQKEDKTLLREYFAKEFREMLADDALDRSALNDPAIWDWIEYLASYHAESRSFARPSPARFLDVLFQSVDKGKKIVVFGAGNFGKRTIKYLKTFGYEVDFLVDNDPLKAGRFVEGVQVKPFDALSVSAEVTVLIAVADTEAQTAIAVQLNERQVEWKIVPATIASYPVQGILVD